MLLKTCKAFGKHLVEEEDVFSIVQARSDTTKVKIKSLEILRLVMQGHAAGVTDAIGYTKYVRNGRKEGVR